MGEYILKHDQLAREDDKGWSLRIQDKNVPLNHCCPDDSIHKKVFFLILLLISTINLFLFIQAMNMKVNF